MTDSTEPSYYEIALTNRQVVIAFVILLTLVLAIFLCGVWVGQRGQERLAGAEPAPPTLPGGGENPEELANLEEFKFFNENEGKAETPPPPRVEPPPPPRSAPPESTPSGTTLAEDIGASDPPPPPREAPREAPRETAPPPPSASPPPTRPVTPPPSASAGQDEPEAREGEWVVQVFSTHDEPQARKLLRQLEAAGHPAFLSRREVSGQRMYRVRVGPYAERGDADAVSVRLRRELKLDPWVTAATN